MILKLRLSHENMANLHRFLHGTDNEIFGPTKGQNLRLLKQKGNNFNGFFDKHKFVEILGTPKSEDVGEDGFVHHVSVELTEEFEIGEHNSSDGWHGIGKRYRTPEEQYVKFFRSIGVFALEPLRQ